MVIFSSGPGQSFVFSVFLGSIIEDTGLSLTGATSLLTASTVASAVLVTVVSRLADRYGPRIMLVAGGLGLGAACFGMATATNLILFFFAFAALRALGQGSLIINCILLVNQWFVSRRGRAISIMTLGVVLSTAIYPPVARFLIDTIGWREAYAVLGAVAIGLIVPAALFVVKNRPEDAGLFPDGSSQPPVSETRQAMAGARRDTRVLTSATFWVLALSLGSPGLVTTGLIVHQTFLFQENGLRTLVSLRAPAIACLVSETGGWDEPSGNNPASSSRFLIDTIGWREAYAVLGAVAIGLIVPAALFVVKNRPEDAGLFPDGSSQPPVSETRQAMAGARRDTRVLTSATFWVLALSLGSPGLVTTGLIVHQTFLFQENGLSATLAAGVFPIYSASSAVSSLASGFVADRVGPKALFVFSMATLLAALALAVVMDSLFVAVVYVVVMGVSLGAFIIVHGTIWAHYYGRHGLGRVQGPSMTISVCASAIGPLPLAVFQDQTGTYTVGLMAMMALPVLAAAGLVFARPGGTNRPEELPSNVPRPS